MDIQSDLNVKNFYVNILRPKQNGFKESLYSDMLLKKYNEKCSMQQLL